MIWVIATDSNHCRIYSYEKKPATLKLINEISHTELRLKKSEFLTSDRPGHYQATNLGRGSYSPPTDPKEVEIIKFSREVAEALNDGRKKQLYKKFILISPAHMNGLILQHIDKNTENLLAKNIKKDYVHTSDKDLLKYLQENIFDLGINQ